jgi:hypothetical protein
MTDSGMNAGVRERRAFTFGRRPVPRMLSQMASACRWPIFLSLPVIFFSLGRYAGAVQREADTLQAGSVVAEKFELVGADGRVAAALYQGPKGEVMLRFSDRKGGSPLMIGLDAKGSQSVLFSDEQRRTRMSLALDGDDGTPHLNMFDERGQAVLTLGVVKGFGPSLDIGKIGSNRISISVSQAGEPSIQLLGQRNAPRISVALLDNSPIITMSDGGDAVRSTWRVMPVGAPSFSLWDRDKKERLVVLTDKDGKPAIRFVDPNNKTIKEIKMDGQ